MPTTRSQTRKSETPSKAPKPEAFEYEFGGPIGALGVMLGLPTVIYALYFTCGEHACLAHPLVVEHHAVGRGLDPLRHRVQPPRLALQHEIDGDRARRPRRAEEFVDLEAERVAHEARVDKRHAEHPLCLARHPEDARREQAVHEERLAPRDGVRVMVRDGVRLRPRDAAICMKSPSQTGCVSGSEMEGVSRSETGSISWSETEFVSGSEIAGTKTSHLAQRDNRGHLGERDGQKKGSLNPKVNHFCGNLGAGGE